MSAFNYIQTFYVNPDTVASATDVMLTSIDLFFKSKPAISRTTSGTAKPGINVWICEVENNQPIPERIIANSLKSVEYDSIPTSSNADTATVVGFTSPVIVKPGKYYGIVIKYADPAFEIWVNKQNDRLVSATGVTNTLSPGSQGRFDGFLYKSTNVNDYITYNDRDLKFRVKVAKFTSSSQTVSLVNKDYEFFTMDYTSTGYFEGGEWVYQVTANSTGTVNFSSSSANIVGTGTNFTTHGLLDYIVLTDGSNKEVVQIKNITNATHMTVDRYPNFGNTSGAYFVPPIGRLYIADYTNNAIILVDSSANATNKFVQSNRVIGVRSGATANIFTIDRYSVDRFKPTFLVGSPATSEFAINYRLANSANQLPTSSINLDLLKFNNSPNKSYILSRSTEVDTTKSSNLFGTRRKSAVANVSMTVNVSEDKRFSVPYINTGELDFYFYQNSINDVYTETRDGIANYDTEVDRNGLAESKYISKKIAFASDKYAEDIVVYLTAFRPANTEIKVYAKIHNAADKEPFDDKSWTPLELKNNTDRFSNPLDPKDVWEYTYGFSQYPEVQAELSGSFLTQNPANNLILTTVDQSNNVTTGDLIRVYDPLIIENHEVFVVLSSNATVIEVNKNISNVNLLGRDVLVDKLKYKNVAWNNIANDNTARYVSTSLVEFDTYTSMQIKVVLLANNSTVVPKVEQIQVIGASA